MTSASAGIWLGLCVIAGLLACLPQGSFCDDEGQTISQIIDTSYYHNYTTLHNLFRRLSQENPTLAKLYSIGQSVQGRELYVLRISSDLDKIEEKNYSKDDLSFALNSKPMFKYVANMHGNYFQSLALYVCKIFNVFREHSHLMLDF